MKRSSTAIAATFLATGIAAAGPYQETPMPPPAPAPSPMWEWFAGASGGYLIDIEEDMYHAHVGVRMNNWSGWATSLYLEGGYAEISDLAPVLDPFAPTAPVAAPFASNLEIIPVTLNFKLDRELNDWLNLYVGVGAGVAFVDYEGYANFASGPLRVSDSDEAFAAQAFAGVGFDVTDNFEIFTGARWIYIDRPSLSVGPVGGGIDFKDDFLVEGGFRFNF